MRNYKMSDWNFCDVEIMNKINKATGLPCWGYSVKREDLNRNNNCPFYEDKNIGIWEAIKSIFNYNRKKNIITKQEYDNLLKSLKKECNKGFYCRDCEHEHDDDL